MFRKGPRSLRRTGSGPPPEPRHPRRSPDTAPKGAETHPGDGRLSVGTASMPLFYIYHARRRKSRTRRLRTGPVSTRPERPRLRLRSRTSPYGRRAVEIHLRQIQYHSSKMAHGTTSGLACQKLEAHLRKIWGLVPGSQPYKARTTHFVNSGKRAHKRPSRPRVHDPGSRAMLIDPRAPDRSARGHARIAEWCRGNRGLAGPGGRGVDPSVSAGGGRGRNFPAARGAARRSGPSFGPTVPYGRPAGPEAGAAATGRTSQSRRGVGRWHWTGSTRTWRRTGATSRSSSRR